MTTYPITIQITFPKQYWPEEMLIDELAESKHINHVDAYTFEDIAVLMTLCTDANTLGICRTSIRSLLERLHIANNKANIDKYTQVIERLLHRNNVSDYARIQMNESFSAQNPKQLLAIRMSYNWHPSKGKFFCLSNLEFDRILSCAAKHGQNVVRLLAVYVVLKSSFYVIPVNNKKLQAGFITKESLAKKCGLSTRAIEPYLTCLRSEGLVSWGSGKHCGVANVYCLPGHEAAIEILMQKQMEYLANKGFKPQVRRLGIKRFEGAY